MKRLITRIASLLLGIVLASGTMALLVNFGFIGFAGAMLITAGLTLC